MRFSMFLNAILLSMIAVATLAIFSAIMTAVVPSFVMPFSPFWGAAYGIPAAITALFINIR